MGTSVNTPSPGNIPAWRMGRAILGRRDKLPEHQLGQIWRAASADLQDSLEGLLSSPGVTAASHIAASAIAPAEARATLANRLRESGDASLFVDIARRALIRTCAKGHGRSGFAEDFFSETTDYYAARDLPSLVGLEGRVQTSKQAIDLKRELRRTTLEVVRSAGSPGDAPEDWGPYVKRVVQALKASR